GSGSIHKNWDKERFLEVYKRLSTGMKGIILLGYAEKQQYDFWHKNISPSCVAEPEKIGDIISYIKKAYFYIGNDSGISHLFAAGGVPSIVIFGPTSPFIWTPLGKNVKILYKGERCSPCSVAQRQLCKHKTCLNSITTDDVIKAIDKLWKKS
ncbi:MAG: glycosyltransferase family 9 protein, partial [Candidatus Omnitrophica bacterium]|nr:glycosyltransferase family 9 protein [Candidatus Omnitrophota bacterium]